MPNTDADRFAAFRAPMGLPRRDFALGVELARFAVTRIAQTHVAKRVGHVLAPAVGEAEDGATIVDCPCGAGPALRALEPGREVRYVAAEVPVAKRAPIWPDLVGAKWESHQVVLRNSPDLALCIAALTSGRGFAILTERRPPRVVRYVESFDAYAVGPRKDEKEMSYWATFDAAITADTVMVLFAGRTADLNRLIDRYSATSGGYLDSYRLPFATKRFAAGGGLIFVADSTGTSVLGLRPGRLKSVSGR